jgi:hypothetical protein
VPEFEGRMFRTSDTDFGIIKALINPRPLTAQWNKSVLRDAVT